MPWVLGVLIALPASVISMVASIQASEDAIGRIEDLKWQHRVLLVFAQESSTAAALSNLNGLATEIEERDIAWFLVTGKNLKTNYPGKLEKEFRENLLNQYFTSTPTHNEVVLIGKDGGEKSREPDLDLEATFGRIDRMPMRKAEISREENP